MGAARDLEVVAPEYIDYSWMTASVSGGYAFNID